MDQSVHGIPDNSYNKHAWILGKPDIGERVWIGAFCLIDALYAPLVVGRGTDISSGAQILTHSTVRRCISEREYDKVDCAAVEIGDFCFIGTNAVILMGSKIGHHSVIAAGAVVTQDSVIPPYSIVSGVPAKIVGSSKKYLKGLNQASVSIVVPAYNEESTIENVVKDAIKNLNKITKDYEIVLVDDGSKDKTGEIIDRLSSRNPKIKAVHHLQNRGFTGAMKTSFQNAKKELIFLAPADGQFDFSELKSFVDAIRGFDIAIGYRVENAEASNRKLNSRIFHMLCTTLLGIHFKEISTVSMWRRKVYQSVTIESDERSAMFLPELIHKAIRARFSFTEVPIHWHQRKGGEAKGANLKVIIKTLREMLKLWYRVNA